MKHITMIRAQHLFLSGHKCFGCWSSRRTQAVDGKPHEVLSPLAPPQDGQESKDPRTSNSVALHSPRIATLAVNTMSTNPSNPFGSTFTKAHCSACMQLGNKHFPMNRASSFCLWAVVMQRPFQRCRHTSRRADLYRHFWLHPRHRGRGICEVPLDIDDAMVCQDSENAGCSSKLVRSGVYLASPRAGGCAGGRIYSWASNKLDTSTICAGGCVNCGGVFFVKSWCS